MTIRQGSRLFIHALRIVATLAAIVPAVVAPAAAQSFPQRPIKLVVPFGAGGPPDVAARIIGSYLTAHLGSIVVENHPGAGGTVASKSVATSPPDGYTLLLATSGSLSISAQLYKNAGYDPAKSFAAISLISTTPLVVAVNSGIPVHSIAELIAYAKANPGKLNYGATIGTPPHMSGEMFKVLTGSKIEFVPYKTASQAASDVLAGQIQMTFEGTTGIKPFIEFGQGQAFGRDKPATAAGISGRSDHAGARHKRHAAGCLAGHRGAGRHAGGRHYQAQQRHQPGSQ